MIDFHDFLYKKMARTKQMERKTNTGFPKATRAEKVEKAEKAERVEKAVAVAVAVAVLFAVMTEIETLKEKFRVDISVNNWKIDLPLQPLSIKSHTYMLSRKCGNYSVLQNYVY